MSYHGKYKLPFDILYDAKLSRIEKAHMLKQWRDDKMDYMRASCEGMVGEDRPDLLTKINIALTAV
ncbi:hypothetical protein [Jiella pacifica]|uniref:Uncharacterized protein n=1 Tax=Jiella pacifica TaxID=2696469 RepID=A0A6N9T930_9HYPH|nr:hypothetical protein [Jiella pacifica]NDW07947.1 hypothetical protein [Jiella pacifica]